MIEEAVDRKLICEKSLELPVKLTDEEVRNRSRQLGQLIQDRASIEEAKKESMAEFKSQIEHVSGRIHNLGRTLVTQSENRQVDCHQYANFTAGAVETVRTDTGEVVEKRAMTERERQRALFDSDELDEEAEAEEAAADETGDEDTDDEEEESEEEVGQQPVEAA